MPGIEPSKTRQVYLVLRDRIAGGRVERSGALPGEQALAAEHGVSRVTVRRALAELEREGLISRRRGAGTVVNGGDRGTKPIVADVADVLANLVAMGRQTDVRLLAFDYVTPPETIGAALGLMAGERTQRSVRVRLIDGEPFSHLTAHVPERIGRTYDAAELSAEPLLALMERSGISAARATQQVTATLAGPEVAAHLGVEVGSALIGLTRTVYAADGGGIEHLSALYRPDRYALNMELVRTKDRNGRHWTAAMPHTVQPATRKAS